MPIDWMRRPVPVPRTFGGGSSGKDVRVSAILYSPAGKRARLKSLSVFVAQSHSGMLWRAGYSSPRSPSKVAKLDGGLPVELVEKQAARARRRR